jgi:hypothetical protein
LTIFAFVEGDMSVVAAAALSFFVPLLALVGAAVVVAVESPRVCVP